MTNDEIERIVQGGQVGPFHYGGAQGARDHRRKEDVHKTGEKRITSKDGE